jgi:Uma2 family endonuclease
MNDHSQHPRAGPRMLPTTQAASGLPRLAWTLEAFERLIETGILSEDDRIELIDGELIPMSPKGNRHERIKTTLLNWFARRLSDDCNIAVELGWRPDGVHYLEPDLVIYNSSASVPNVAASEILLAIEIAHSSLAYDLGLKAKIYASLGVRDYWVIDAVTLETHLFRDPTPDGYSTTFTHVAIATLIPLVLPDLALSLADLSLG